MSRSCLKICRPPLTATAARPNLTESDKKLLYPDLDKLKAEEKRRFELLISHWDVETTTVEVGK